MMLHGFLGESSDWQAIAKTIPKEIGCYAIDLPGHGKSASIELNSALGFKQCSNLISSTLLKQGISEYILVGYSMGGRIALYHATHKSEHIRGLILESCHIGLTNLEEKQERLLNDTYWAQKFSSEHLPEVLKSWYQQNIFNSLTFQQKETLIAMRSQLNGDIIGKMLLATSLAKQEFLAEKLTKSQIPSYYLYGKKDNKYQNIAKEFKEISPQLQTVEFLQAGHNIHFEQSEVFSEQIIKLYIQLCQ